MFLFLARSKYRNALSIPQADWSEKVWNAVPHFSREDLSGIGKHSFLSIGRGTLFPFARV